ncbi:MAG: hypothetical protein WC884_02685 [Candidatus Paceibacterota bacterium]
MFGENKNLKDSSKDSVTDTTSLPIPYKVARLHLGSYTKIDKLITALYMVTDIIDKEEPLRNKLRTLGTGIISDIHLSQENYIGHIASLILAKIQEIMSFLDIASDVNIISSMNCNILRKEFLEFDQSIREFNDSAGNKINTFNKQINLIEFFKNSPLEGWPKAGVDKFIPPPPKGYSSRGELNFKGHTSIGVQKGSTLLKALSKVRVSDMKINHTSKDEFNLLKKQRRDEITNLIIKNGGSVTITDIKNGAYGSLISCGEKTLQRELVSMVVGGVLKKEGSKRWSRYFIK